jgi:GT2 family glycosyltransferase
VAPENPTRGLAIIVATRNRDRHLRRLLTSIFAATGVAELAPEVVVADNGSTDATAAVVDEAARTHRNLRRLAVPEAGKSRALNAAIRASTAPLLAFVDDDVELDREWLVAVDAYFARHAVGAAQATIRVAREAAANAAVAAAIERWHTVPRCDYGPGVTESRSLIGANMIVARSTFARVGLFDERLGPGAAGASEDTELAERIVAAGIAIGYVPDAIVYHAVERERLSAEFFRALHESRGRSRLYYKDAGRRSPLALTLRLLPDLASAALGIAASAFARGGESRRRALARWYHYRAMLAAGRAPRLAGGVPRLDEP